MRIHPAARTINPVSTNSPLRSKRRAAVTLHKFTSTERAVTDAQGAVLANLKAAFAARSRLAKRDLLAQLYAQSVELNIATQIENGPLRQRLHRFAQWWRSGRHRADAAALLRALHSDDEEVIGTCLWFGEPGIAKRALKAVHDAPVASVDTLARVVVWMPSQLKGPWNEMPMQIPDGTNNLLDLIAHSIVAQRGAARPQFVRALCARVEALQDPATPRTWTVTRCLSASYVHSAVCRAFCDSLLGRKESDRLEGITEPLHERLCGVN